MIFNRFVSSILNSFSHSNVSRGLASLLTLVMALGFTLPVAMDAQAGSRSERYAAGHIIVKPRDTVGEAQFDAAIARHGGKSKSRLQSTRMHIVTVSQGSEESMVQALALDPDVEFAELDRLVAPEVTSANDTYFSNAWHLTTLGVSTAWDIAKGNGVIVAILDSGVDSTHPDLVGKLVSGWNLVDNNSNTSDVYGHGTMVAGVVGAVSNNGSGVTSIAWQTQLMPVRVAETSGSAYISTIANGISWAADHGAHIANASFATLTGSATIQSAANYMRSKGGLVVVAAGNYGTLDSTPNNSSVISVSATTSSDSLASWSSYGPYVDVAAPGEGIWTTTNGGGYASVSGTSFSSPVTAAVLALMKSANPALSNVTLEALLESTARDLNTPGYDQYYGYGRVDAAAAVAAAASYASVGDTQPPSVNVTQPTGGTVASSITVTVSATDNVGVSRVELYAGSTLIGSSTSAPYSFTWNTLSAANGTVTLTANAYDSANNKGVSTGVNVNVSNTVDTIAPNVNILTPTSGSTVIGTVSISASASDNVAVATMTLYIDGSISSVTSGSSMSYSWNTRKLSGTHTLSAKATDALGNSSTHSINVTVGSKRH